MVPTRRLAAAIVFLVACGCCCQKTRRATAARADEPKDLRTPVRLAWVTPKSGAVVRGLAVRLKGQFRGPGANEGYVVIDGFPVFFLKEFSYVRSYPSPGRVKIRIGFKRGTLGDDVEHVAVLRLLLEPDTEADKRVTEIRRVLTPDVIREDALPEIRYAALQKELRLTETLELLVRSHQDRGVQQNAISALGAMGSIDSVPTLVACFERPGLEIDADVALSSITNKSFGAIDPDDPEAAPARMKKWVSWFAKNEDRLRRLRGQPR